jgi:hypothetical protein
MYTLIAVHGENKSPFPILESNDQDEETGLMAQWESREEAETFARDHMLCNRSETIIVNLQSGQSEFL